MICKFKFQIILTLSILYVKKKFYMKNIFKKNFLCKFVKKHWGFHFKKVSFVVHMQMLKFLNL